MRLFKYVTITNAILILKNKSIRFTPSSLFNDPYEVSLSALVPNFSIKEQDRHNLDSLLDEITSQLSFKGEFSKEKSCRLKKHLTALNKMRLIQGYEKLACEFIENDILNILHNHYGILSLSERRDIILMWSDYTNNYTGVVLEIEIDNEFMKDCIKKNCFNVKYVEKHPGKNWCNLSIEDFFIFKNTHWEYECERRLIIPLNKLPEYLSNDISLGSRHGHSQIDGIYRAILTKKLKASQIISVTLGCNFNDNSSMEKKRIKDILNSTDYEHVKIDRSYMVEGMYDLRFQDETRIFRM